MRTCLAKGEVEAQEDMPSIVCMSKQGDKGTRRKPVVAHAIHGTKAADDLSDVETTADEADESCSCVESELLSSHESPMCSRQCVLLSHSPELRDWPALHLGSFSDHTAVGESRPSHLEIATRFVSESLNELAAIEQLRARKEAIGSAEREAGMWKTYFKKRRQLPRTATMSQARTEKNEALAMVESCLINEADHDGVKLARAATRHRKLYIKRTDFTRPRCARDWTWGSSIEGAKPHHAVRVAVRACLSKGAVESHEDMPRIVCLGRHGDKATRRKPAVTRPLRNATVVQKDTANTNSLDVGPGRSNVETGYGIRQQQNNNPQEALQACNLAISAEEFSDATNAVPGKQAKTEMWCVIA
jgi:hypothetical protein